MAMGRVDVDAMVAEMGSLDQLYDWRIYTELEGLPDDRLAMRFAHVVKTLIDVNRKKGAEPFKLKDALLLIGDENEPTTRATSPDDARTRGKKWSAAFRQLAAEQEKAAEADDRKRAQRAAAHERAMNAPEPPRRRRRRREES